MADPLRLGVAGLGTVGAGLVRIVQRNARLVEARGGRRVIISAVCARSRGKDRNLDLDGHGWEDDPVALARRDDVDVFVELMGGGEGPAKASVEAAIAAGKHVVTANKALLAEHGHALALAAEEARVALRFEAAVAGGIPIVKALSESLAGNEITRVLGVMNGTCNYILTRMWDAGLPYETVFEEASDLGYLEADPTLDVGGIDAAHKLALLVSIAFGERVKFDGIEIEGIERVSIDDIKQAADMGYRIKLLGVARRSGNGVEARMSPCLVPEGSPLGQLPGATNMVVVEGDSVNQIVLRGPGAGEGPTASAVMGDIVDIARNLVAPVFGQPAETLAEPIRIRGATPTPFYLRMTIADRPGALAKVAHALGEAGVSINRMRQYRHSEPHAPVLIMTHDCVPADLDRAIESLAVTGVVEGDPVAFRVEEV